jgi:aryl-alcohol dehydrogenase (NADP+)
MDYVRLGRTGLKVSRLCLGTMTYGSRSWRDWVLDEEAGRPLIRAALEAGINFLDTADVYSTGVSEEIVGRALKDFARRDDIVLATKVYNVMGPGPNDRGLSRKHIMAAIDASLRRLQTDYVDLYQIHRWDYETPIEETLEALDDVVRAGKARYIGASSMFAWQFATALHLSDRHGWSRFVSMQNHYNLAYREEEREMIPLCLAEGVGVIPWSPLARGVLAGNRASQTLRAQTDEYGKRMYKDQVDGPVVERCAAVARKRGVPPAQIALAWMLHKPAITAPIVGVSKPHHLSDAVAALSISLSPAEIAELEEPYQPHAVLGHQ